MPPCIMIAMQQLQTQLHRITQLSDWAELESWIPNKFTTEFFSTHDHVMSDPQVLSLSILNISNNSCPIWPRSVYNLFIPFTKSSSQSNNMTYRKIYTIYHRQQSTRTGLNRHLTALHTKYITVYYHDYSIGPSRASVCFPHHNAHEVHNCLLSWLFNRTIESERLFSAPQCISRCTISGTNGTFPKIRLVQYH